MPIHGAENESVSLILEKGANEINLVDVGDTDKLTNIAVFHSLYIGDDGLIHHQQSEKYF